VAVDASLKLVYDNLVYACHKCNLHKGKRLFIDPCTEAYGDHLEVNDDGKIKSQTRQGQRLIRLLKLDTDSAIRVRFIKIRCERSLAQNDPIGYVALMGYPDRDELPDIEALNQEVPNNTRPDGVDKSCRARHKRGELPEYY
jgi:hypothetical protein